MTQVSLIIDAGNSETRAVLRVGEIEDKSRREFPFKLSNRFALAFDGVNISDEYNEDNSTVFTIKPHKVGSAKVEGGTHVNGLISEREFQRLQSSPTALVQKYNSHFTFLTVMTAISESARIVKKYFAEQGQDLSLEKIYNSLTWSITLLLPPSQTDKGKKILAESLVGEFNVDYQIPSVNATVRIDNVNAFSEGVMAYTAVLFNKNKTPRTDKIFMATSSVLVIDIGAGTTDIVVMENGRLIEASKHTIDRGGNNIKSILRQKVVKDYDFKLPESTYDEAAVTGVVKQGIKQHDVSTQLNIAKREVAAMINNEIRLFLESASISVQTIDYILVVGGGSINSGKLDITPISEYILDGLRVYSPQVELIDITSLTDPDAISLSGNNDSISARDLNIVGAGIALDNLEQRQKAKN